MVVMASDQERQIEVAQIELVAFDQSKASAKRVSSGNDLAPVRFMIEARWFSTVRWLI